MGHDHLVRRKKMLLQLNTQKCGGDLVNSVTDLHLDMRKSVCSAFTPEM